MAGEADLISGVVGGFMQGARDGENYADRQNDRRMKNLEWQAKLKSEEEQKKRQAFTDAITMKKEHVSQGPNGELVDMPLNPQEVGEVKHKDLVEHGYDSEYDPATRQWKSKVNPDSLKAKVMANRTMGQNESIDLRKDVVDRREHEKVLGRLSQNKNVRDRLNQFQNLDNAMATITQAEHVTPQQVAEFQQAVRANMGIKGSSGVGEREETQIKTLGLNAANMKQFLTGDPATLSKDSNLMKHLKDLATVEQGNIKRQFDKTLAAATGGHASMYSRRPDLSADLKDALEAQRGQFEGGVNEQPVAGAPVPVNQAGSEGLVNGGLLNAAKGFLFGSPVKTSHQTPTVTPHPQDNEAVAWAKANINKPENAEKAAAILKANGVQ